MIGSFSFYFSQQTIDDMDMEVGTILFCLLPLSEVWSFSKHLLIKRLYKKKSLHILFKGMPWRTSKTVITVRVSDKYAVVS